MAVRNGVWSPQPSDSAPAVVQLSDGRPAGPDSATARYLASHGYTVVTGAGRSSGRPRAWIELHPAGSLVRVAVAGQILTVGTPPGPSDHVRLSAAVTHAVLDAALRLSPPALPDVARRLRAAGLVVQIAPGNR